MPGCSGRDLLGPQPADRPARSRRRRRRRTGPRDCGPSPPDRRDLQAGEAAPIPNGRPGAPGCGRPPTPAGAVVLLPGAPRDAIHVGPAVPVPGADPPSPQAGEAADRPRDPGLGDPTREGEPSVGLHADPRRTAQARDRRLRHHHRDASSSSRTGAGSPQDRPHLVGVPPRPGVRLPPEGSWSRPGGRGLRCRRSSHRSSSARRWSTSRSRRRCGRRDRRSS